MDVFQTLFVFTSKTINSVRLLKIIIGNDRLTWSPCWILTSKERAIKQKIAIVRQYKIKHWSLFANWVYLTRMKTVTKWVWLPRITEFDRLVWRKQRQNGHWVWLNCMKENQQSKICLPYPLSIYLSVLKSL